MRYYYREMRAQLRAIIPRPRAGVQMLSLQITEIEHSCELCKMNVLIPGPKLLQTCIRFQNAIGTKKWYHVLSKVHNDVPIPHNQLLHLFISVGLLIIMSTLYFH